MSTDLYDLPADAVAVSAIRALSNGSLRQYSGTTFPDDPRGGCVWQIRKARACGFIAPSSADGYAVLDILNEAGDIVADFDIPSARAFRWWKRTMGWTVES